MPMLRNLRHEAFAQGLAAGGAQRAAYAEAGFKDSASAACKCAARPDVRARVAELREGADVTEAVRFLTGIAERAKEMDSAAGLNTARVAKLDALKLKRERDAAGAPAAVGSPAAAAAWTPDPDLPPLLTPEEWILKHVPLDYRPDVLAKHLAYQRQVADTDVPWAGPTDRWHRPLDPMGAAPDLDDD